MSEYMERITEQSEWREYFYRECCEYEEFRDETDRRPQLKKCPYCKSEAIERQSGREDPVTFFFIEDYFCKQCNKVVAYRSNGWACSFGPKNPN